MAVINLVLTCEIIGITLWSGTTLWKEDCYGSIHQQGSAGVRGGDANTVPIRRQGRQWIAWAEARCVHRGRRRDAGVTAVGRGCPSAKGPGYGKTPSTGRP